MTKPLSFCYILCLAEKKQGKLSLKKVISKFQKEISSPLDLAKNKFARSKKIRTEKKKNNVFAKINRSTNYLLVYTTADAFKHAGHSIRTARAHVGLPNMVALDYFIFLFTPHYWIHSRVWSSNPLRGFLPEVWHRQKSIVSASCQLMH